MCFRINLGLPLFNKICKFSYQTKKNKKFDLGKINLGLKKKKTNVARYVSVDVVIKIRPFDTSDFSIHEITAGTKLTRH